MTWTCGAEDLTWTWICCERDGVEDLDSTWSSRPEELTWTWRFDDLTWTW